MRWFQKLSRQAQLCLVVCIILPFFFTIGLLAAKPNSQDFVDAHRIAPAGLIKKVITENYFSTNKTPSLKALKLEGENPLYIFDFNTPDLCGVGGCLYVGYLADGTRVLSLYLKELPENIKLFSADSTQNHYPCVAVSQTDSKSRLVKKRYCYQGGKMVSVFQQLVEGGQ
jgi:hypothetical protein